MLPDAAIATGEFGARRELGLTVLARASDALPQFMRICVVTRGDTLRSRPTGRHGSWRHR